MLLISANTIPEDKEKFVLIISWYRGVKPKP